MNPGRICLTVAMPGHSGLRGFRKHCQVILSSHHERPSGREGSAVSLSGGPSANQKQIPRFARNDNSRRVVHSQMRGTDFGRAPLVVTPRCEPRPFRACCPGLKMNCKSPILATGYWLLILEVPWNRFVIIFSSAHRKKLKEFPAARRQARSAFSMPCIASSAAKD